MPLAEVARREEAQGEQSAFDSLEVGRVVDTTNSQQMLGSIARWGGGPCLP